MESVVFFEKTVKRSQATEEEGVHKGRKQGRKLFVCHKEQIKIWVRIEKSAELQRSCQTGWAMVILHGSNSNSHFSFFFFFVICSWSMNYIFSPIIPKSSVKFLLTKNLRSLVQAYPSINHWWSITFATLPSIERAQPILLNTRTRYTVATNWYTFTHIYIWSSTSREMPESIIKCMIQQEVCSCDYIIDKLISYYTDSVKE